ncbi:MAG: PH domain-containing protein [Lysobacter sp.]|nr:PH domain-containing protein [Lysobacter sp.]
MGLLDALLGHAGEKKIDDLHEEFAPLLAPGETLQRAFALIRDLIVFTDRRLIPERVMPFFVCPEGRPGA